ncbi:MAG: hypothetical protein ACFFB5_08980 [Promethearchaeota archaeon]
MKHSQFALSYVDSLDFLHKIKKINHQFIYNKIEKIFQYINVRGDFQCKIQFAPLLFAKKLDLLNLNRFIDILPAEPLYLILLIRAGYAALGFSQNGILTHHKVIKKYMVRKKQGKAQLTYQAQRGKARGGAKLRLARTNEFLIEINTKLNDWQDSIKEAQWIMFQCSPRLWNGIFKTKILTPFDKNDERLHKIGLNTYKPSYGELQRINGLLLQTTINLYAKERVGSIEDLLFQLTTEASD